MSHLEINLDMDHLNAAIKPLLKQVIDEELVKTDVKAKIAAMLNEDSGRSGYFGVHPYERSRSMIDEAIHNILRKEVESFVKSHVFAHKDFLEDALLKAIRNSEDKLTKAFVKSMLDAVDGGVWDFNLSMKLTATGVDDETRRDAIPL